MWQGAAGERSAPAADRASAAEAFTLGKALAAEGSYREALAHLRLAVERAPAEPYLHLELALLAYRLGRVDEAVTHARRARQLAPADPDVLGGVAEVMLGLADERNELLAEGQEALERRLEVGGGDEPETLHALGRLYHSRGDFARAEELYRRLVAAVPESRAAGSQLLHLLLQRGKKADAAELLREQLAGDPGSLELRLSLADLLSESADHTSAAAVLRAAPAEHAGHPEVRRRLAFELYRSGELAAAVDLVEGLLAQGPEPRLRLFRALLLEEQGRESEALAELQGLYGEQPEDPEVGLSLARLLMREERQAEARQLLEGLLAALAVSAEGPRRGELGVADRVRLELAQLHAAGDGWAEVLRLTGEVSTEAEPALRAAALLLRSDALVALERGEEALAGLRPAAGLAPATLAAKRAEVLLELGREGEAEIELARLGDDAAARRRAAEVYQRAGRHDRAVPLLERLVADEPASTELRFRLGAAYERSGQHPAAVSTFRELLRQAPDFHMALNYLGYMWAEKGENLVEARVLVERALALDPDNPAYVDSLGWVYYQLGDYPRALEQLEHAARRLPSDGTIQEHLGDVLRALGRIDAARSAYQRALALGADNVEQVQRKLEEVGRDQPPR